LIFHDETDYQADKCPSSFLSNEPVVRDRLKVVFFPSSSPPKKSALQATRFFILFKADYENVSLHRVGVQAT
jgi:hypothetical protein